MAPGTVQSFPFITSISTAVSGAKIGKQATKSTGIKKPSVLESCLLSAVNHSVLLLVDRISLLVTDGILQWSYYSFPNVILMSSCVVLIFRLWHGRILNNISVYFL